MKISHGINMTAVVITDAVLSRKSEAASRKARRTSANAPVSRALAATRKVTSHATLPVSMARTFLSPVILSNSDCVSDSCCWISMRSLTVAEGFESIARRLSRNAVRFLIFASVSTTSADLSWRAVECDAIVPSDARRLASLFKSSGTTPRVMSPEGAESAVRVVIVDDTTSQRIAPQNEIADSQDSWRLDSAVMISNLSVSAMKCSDVLSKSLGSYVYANSLVIEFITTAAGFLHPAIVTKQKVII